jgi:NAD(P)-dependent dehydrogenase (short-subunit alcohol dehydrogenase family)
MPELKPEDAGRFRTLRDILTFAGGPAIVSDTLTRHELRLTQSAACGLPLPGLFTSGTIAVIDTDSTAAEALVSQLGKLHISAHCANSVPDGCRAVIYLGGLRTSYEAFEIARSLAHGSEAPGLFVTVHHGAWAAGIGGVAKTFAREWPDAAVKTIDLERGERSYWEIADAIAAELLAGGSQIEVSLRADGSRLTPLLYSAELGQASERIGPDSVILASGGARGVTAACLIELARTTRARIALLGRTPLEDEPADCRAAQDEGELKRILSRRQGSAQELKDVSRMVARILAVREIRSTLDALEKAGSPCAYFAADMLDARSVQRGVAAARERFGAITAIIHGAGVIADRKIADKTDDQFALVFETKVTGLRALLAATESDPVDTICLFSSVAARFGNAGQCDYAAANEVLNKVAAFEAQRRGFECVVRSIAWGPWDGGMVTAPLAAHFRSRGAELIPLASGARAFVRELQHVAAGAEVVIAAEGNPFSELASKAEYTTEILVNRETYPFLDSHRIQQHAVVPLVLVNEWFHRFAESCRPAMRVVNCGDLRVLRGVSLPAFESEGHLLRIFAKVLDAGEIHCELRSMDGTLHYSAALELRAGSQLAESAASPKARVVSEVYAVGRDLFHGPDFQVIEEVLSLDESVATAVLSTTGKMGWPAGPWKTDAAALDGALQLIRLWSVRHMGAPSLPTRIGSFVRHSFGTAPDSLLCEVRPRAAGTLSIVADVRLLLDDGRLFAEMRAVEMHLTSGS